MKPFKYLLAATFSFSALVIGLWTLSRRTPTPLEEGDARAMFVAEPEGLGFRVRLVDTQTPLRRLHWLPPLPQGWMLGQLLTQTDRQMLAILREGRLEDVLTLPTPPNLDTRFFRFAELRDALLLPDGTLTLLYVDAGEDPLPSLVLALEATTRRLRWAHRAPGARLALGTSDKCTAIFLWGPGTPITRLEASAPADGLRIPAQTLQWPEEVLAPSDLLPIDPSSFWVAHAQGLSVCQGLQGWRHHPLPEPDPGALTYPQGQGRLASGSGQAWWQPWPGQLLRLTGGSPAPTEILQKLTPEPHERDARLLTLLGVDAEGRPWFGLAEPLLQPGPALDPPILEEGWRPDPAAAESLPGALPALEQEAWRTYLAQPLDRVYRWDHRGHRWEVFTWGEAWRALGLPETSEAPPELHPSTGALITGQGARILWAHLSALPWRPAASPGDRPLMTPSVERASAGQPR